jgi:hypothetical protein
MSPSSAPAAVVPGRCRQPVRRRRRRASGLASSPSASTRTPCRKATRRQIASSRSGIGVVPRCGPVDLLVHDDVVVARLAPPRAHRVVAALRG